MTNAVTVKNITFQEGGNPSFVVPLIGKTLDEILGNAHGLVDAGADIIEWRVDHFTQVRDTDPGDGRAGGNPWRAESAPAAVHLPQQERRWRNRDQRRSVLRAQIAKPRAADWLMLSISELFNDEAQIRALVDDAHAAGVKVIMSNHDFHKTPAQGRYYLSPAPHAGSGAPTCRRSR